MKEGSRIPGQVEVFSRYFEELAVGESFGAGPRVISEQDVHTFAALSGDWHPQHTDAEWAKRSSFGARIAHGALVLSCGLGLIEVDPERALALRRIRDAVFKRPLYIGEPIRLRGRVEALRAVDEATGIVLCGCRIVNEQDRCVVAARIEVLWRRAAAQPSAVVQGDETPAVTA